MSKKKIPFLPILLFSIALVFSGCGQKTPATNSEPSKPPMQPKITQEEKDDPAIEENLPVPTGEVDDIVNAALESANSEKTEISQDESDALSSVDDSEETNYFGQTYDENEF